MTKQRVKDLNKILTCILCKGYMIEATTINICMHSFCRTCIIKHVDLLQNYTCPDCDVEIRLSNLRPDYRLRSICYKVIPGLFMKMQQLYGETSDKDDNYYSNKFAGKSETCAEDKFLQSQYFFDQDEPISLSIQYHMESVLGNCILLNNNIPQVRYLQAPAAFKVNHMKKFLSSKYDLNFFKKSMKIDIIYQGTILNDELTLMDIAYTFNWKREAPMKLFYRVHKSTKKLESIKTLKPTLPTIHLKSSTTANNDWNKKSAEESVSHQNSTNNPPLNLKIIIAKKPRNKNRHIGYEQHNKERLNKPNSTKCSSTTKDLKSSSERLRSDVEFCSYFASSSQSSPSSASSSSSYSLLKASTSSSSALEKKTDNRNNSMLDNNSAKKHHHRENSTSSSKKLSSSSSSSTSTSSSNMKVNTIPKLKFGTAVESNKITVPKKSDIESSSNKKLSSEIIPSKRVRFEDEQYENDEVVDQLKYAQQIGLRPVVRTVESIILHRKRKKSKHSKDFADYCKRPKVHVSSTLNENLKLKLKITGKNNYKNSSKKIDDNCKSSSLSSSVGLVHNNQYIRKDHENQNEIEQTKKSDIEKNVSSSLLKNDEGGGLENYKYSLTEQHNVDSFGANSTPMVFIPKLVLDTGVKENNHKIGKSEQPTPTSSPSRTEISIIEKLTETPHPDINWCNSSKFMKPPRAKMGSPKQNPTSNFQISPVRPQSIPASNNSDNMSTLKRSMSTEEDSFSSRNKHVLFPPAPKRPTPYFMHASSTNNNFSTMLAMKKSNLTVKDPMKLFPNACPSIEILKIPQKVTLKPNFKLPETIPLERIKKSAPKFYSNEGARRVTEQQYNSHIDDNYSGNFQSRFNVVSNDINLERYTVELKNDIAKLDRNLSMEKNYEHWERQKLEEYQRMIEPKFPLKNQMLSQKSLSVRNVPNPSAIAMSRNQMMHPDIEDIIAQSKISKTQQKTEKKSIDKLTEILLNVAKSKDSTYEGDKNNNKKSSDNPEVSSSSTSPISESSHIKRVNFNVTDVICLDS